MNEWKRERERRKKGKVNCLKLFHAFRCTKVLFNLVIFSHFYLRLVVCEWVHMKREHIHGYGNGMKGRMREKEENVNENVYKMNILCGGGGYRV